MQNTEHYNRCRTELHHGITLPHAARRAVTRMRAATPTFSGDWESRTRLHPAWHVRSTTRSGWARCGRPSRASVRKVADAGGGSETRTGGWRRRPASRRWRPRGSPGRSVAGIDRRVPSESGIGARTARVSRVVPRPFGRSSADRTRPTWELDVRRRKQVSTHLLRGVSRSACGPTLGTASGASSEHGPNVGGWTSSCAPARQRAGRARGSRARW